MIKQARWSIALALLLSACAQDTTDEQESPAEAEEAILQAPSGKSFVGTVHLIMDLGNGSVGDCTATVLSEHWLLTAAHCLAGKPSILNGTVRAPLSNDGMSEMPDEQAYDYSPMELFPHPSWSDGPRYDVGLVHLMSYGIDTSSIGRTKLYSGSTTYSLSSTMIVAGFGYGTPTGGSTSCAGGLGTFRYRTQSWNTDQLLWNVRGGKFVTSTSDYHCPGDSGGPWMTTSSTGHIQFAVHSHPYNGGDSAPTIQSMRSWIESKMQTRLPSGFLWSYDAGSSGGVPYRAYKELGTPMAQLHIDGYCLEPEALTLGSHVVLRPCSNSWAQQWWITQIGEVRNLGFSSACLDIEGGSIDSGAAAIVSSCDKVSKSQRHRYIDNGPIHYGKKYDKCMDLQWGSAYNGAPIWLYDCNGSAAQTFQFYN